MQLHSALSLLILTVFTYGSEASKGGRYCPKGEKPTTGFIIDQKKPTDCVWSEWCKEKKHFYYFPASTYDNGEKACRERLSQLDCTSECAAILCIAQAGVYCGRREDGTCGCVGPKPEPPIQIEPVCNPPCSESEKCVQVNCIRAPCPPMCQDPDPPSLDCSSECALIDCIAQEGVYCGRMEDGTCGCVQPKPEPPVQIEPLCDPPCSGDCETCVQVNCFRAPCPPMCQPIEGCLPKPDPVPPNDDCSSQCAAISCIALDGVYCGRTDDGTCGCVQPKIAPPLPPAPACDPPCSGDCETCVQVNCIQAPCPPMCQPIEGCLPKPDPVPPNDDCSSQCARMFCLALDGVYCGRMEDGTCGCVQPKPAPPLLPALVCDPPCSGDCEKCVQVTCVRAPCPPLCQRVEDCKPKPTTTPSECDPPCTDNCERCATAPCFAPPCPLVCQRIEGCVRG